MLQLAHIDFVWSDGGREAAGYKGSAGDCTVRAVAIALELDYKRVYDDLHAMMKLDAGKAKAVGMTFGDTSPRNGVYPQHTREYMASHGWTWVPKMRVGSGCTVHLKRGELPMGRIVVRLSKHVAAVIDGVLHDTYDCSRDGTRCVYGYWMQEKPQYT